MIQRPLIPVILCGGTGSRLWPLSRASYPKQFLALNIQNDKTLLQETHQRIQGIKGLQAPFLICNEEHRFIVAEQMREIGVNEKTILLEPIGRNTAPAISIAALKATEKNQDPYLLVLSADHIINDQKKFINTINTGLESAELGRIVTFGIDPKYPETGYGYIEAEERNENPLIPSRIKRFIEKPNQETAKKFLKDNRFTWNSGIFLFKASTIIEEMNRSFPKILYHCKNALKDSYKDLDFIRLDNKDFQKCPNISIDIAVMENTTIGTVLPLNIEWKDIGSWKSIWEEARKNKEGNVLKGKTFAMDSYNCYLHSEHRLLVSLGVKDLIIVETDDAILVADREKSQEVKLIVEKLQLLNKPEAKMHKKIYRPWGYYISIVHEKRWQVKRIEVNPGASLSLQMHHHRSEHWVVVKGTALVEKDSEKQLLGENQSTYIPLGCKHKLTNPGKIPLELIEIQSGGYIGEDDIIRLEDMYGRKT